MSYFMYCQYIISTCLYLNLQGARKMGRNQITEKCFYWMPQVQGNQSIYLIRQNTMKAFLMMMAAAMILTIYLHNTHTLSETSLSKSNICMQFWLSCIDRRLCQPCWNGTLRTSCMECYRQPHTDALLSGMNCCSKSNIIYFRLTASNVYSQ